MHSLSRHILILGRLLLVLFILANTGFTLILYECTMCEAADDMARCGDSHPAAANACPDMNSPQPMGTTPVVHNLSCMVTTVAGGLQTDPKFVEKVSTTPQLPKIDFVPVTLSALLNGPYVDRPFCLLSSVDSNISPPSVEKYVLTGAFLI